MSYLKASFRIIRIQLDLHTVNSWNIDNNELNHLFKHYYSIKESANNSATVEDSNVELCILVRSNDYSDANRHLLGKILAAIGQNIDQCYVKQFDTDETTDNALSQIKTPKAVLSFGIPLPNNPILYQINRFETSQLLASDSLTQLASSQDKKRLLWTALKQLQF